MNAFNQPNMFIPNFTNMNQNNYNSPLSLNDFEIIETIAKGSLSSVFKVKYKMNGQIYAVKQYDKTKGKKEQDIDYIREKAILYDITQKGYRNIVKLYADFEDDKTRNLVMEYVEGINLKQLRGDNNNGYISQDLIINILTQLLEALQFLHDKCHIIHRDIKPDNIILQKDNNIKLLGFGISVYLQNSNNILVSNKTLKGELRFVPPEMILYGFPPEYDYKMDIFSLGFTMYSIMNPSNDGINLPQKTERKDGKFIRTKQYLENKFYHPDLIEFIKHLYENDKNKRPTSSNALDLLKNVQYKIYSPNNINNNINNNTNNNLNPNLNQIPINSQQLNYNFINPNINNTIFSQQNIGTEANFLNPNTINDENKIISSMKSLLQILSRLDIMNFIKAQLAGLIQNNQIINNNQLFIHSFIEVMNFTQQYNYGNINSINYNQIIKDFIQRVLSNNNSGVNGNRPISLFFNISFIIKNEINKYFNIYQNNIFDNMIQNNFMTLNNLIPLTNQLVYNSISGDILNFKNNYKGPFVDNFNFLIISISRCPNCNNLFGINCQISQFLQLDVKNPQNNISDLINSYFGSKIGIGDYNCKNCGLQGKKSKITYCLNLPNYLILEFEDKNSVNFNDNINIPLFNGQMHSYQYLSSIYKFKNNNTSKFVAIIKNGNNYLFYSDDKIEPCPQNFVNLECPSMAIFKKISN